VIEVPADADGGGPRTTEDVDHGVAREIPEDPRTGVDQALKAAYEIAIGARKIEASP
jgi:hypothetical protein